MAVLLDTQVVIWMEEDHSKMSDHAKTKILSEPDLFISKVSIWEMAIKIKIGKLSLDKELSKFVDDFLIGFKCRLLNIEVEHLYRTMELPFYHRDPFDRLLIAQSLVEEIALISSDKAFDTYDIQKIW